MFNTCMKTIQTEDVFFSRCAWLFIGLFAKTKWRCKSSCRVHVESMQRWSTSDVSLLRKMNASQQTHFSSYWKVESVIISVIFSVIFLVGTVGNCLVLAVLIRNGQMNTKSTNLFILNLGLADLCFIVFCVPLQATIYTMDEWVFGQFVCKAVHFIIYLTMYASIFTLAAVSLDRCVPFRTCSAGFSFPFSDSCSNAKIISNNCTQM